MARKRYKPEEIVAKLRQVDVLVSQGQNMVADRGHRAAQQESAARRCAHKSLWTVEVGAILIARAFFVAQKAGIEPIWGNCNGSRDQRYATPHRRGIDPSGKRLCERTKCSGT
jgi:hypothetical protein